MNPTQLFIERLTRLDNGGLSMLRGHAGSDLAAAVEAFDLFAGLWWPIRQQHGQAPRREVAWLIAKLYAFKPLPQTGGHNLASRLALRRPRDAEGGNRFDQRFDALMTIPFAGVETDLRWALGQLEGRHEGLDWVRLATDLTEWRNRKTRLRWVRTYLDTTSK